MKSLRRFSQWQITFWLWLLIVVGFPLASRGQEQPASPSQTNDSTFPALLVSDIHFDPFHDPAMVQDLIKAPLSQWESILSAPPSPNQPQAFAALQQTCHAGGVDTPYALLSSSLQAMWSRQPDAKFMTVSGDLIAHAFSCKYTTLVPGSKPSDYQAFVLKTLSFVMGELRARFPGMPVYVALGNNDSACGDYQLDAGSDFLVQSAKVIALGLPPSQQNKVLKEFAQGGYYSVTMEAPMPDTRLIVINDVFLSPKYTTCSGKPDPAAATAEMKWLQEELDQARRLGQKVWVMGHIPPGVDPYSTVAKLKDVCGREGPEMFLSSDRLADLLIEHAGVIRLGIFAHSHMDEIRLLEPQNSGPQAPKGDGVAIKLVPSVSPVDGNNPGFIVGRVSQSSAGLQNYQVIAASNQTGIAANWSTEYEFAQTYHEAQFSPSAVKKLIAEFENDHGAKTEASRAYIRNFYAGDRSSELEPFWPLYVCALSHYTAKAFAACECSKPVAGR